MVATSGVSQGLQFSVPDAQVVRPGSVAALPTQLGAAGPPGHQLVTLPGGQQALVRYAAPQMVQVRIQAIIIVAVFCTMTNLQYLLIKLFFCG